MISMKKMINPFFGEFYSIKRFDQDHDKRSGPAAVDTVFKDVARLFLDNDLNNMLFFVRRKKMRTSLLFDRHQTFYALLTKAFENLIDSGWIAANDFGNFTLRIAFQRKAHDHAMVKNTVSRMVFFKSFELFKNFII